LRASPGLVGFPVRIACRGSGRTPSARGVIGELRRLHRHIWIAWILIVGVAAAFLVWMQP